MVMMRMRIRHVSFGRGQALLSIGDSVTLEKMIFDLSLF